MAGLEVVVRPVVLPNIRPAPARSLPPADDPDKGFCVIKGNGGKHVDLTYSFSFSRSESRMVEKERRVDEARVYQKEDDGTVNRENFVDMQVANRIKSEGGKGPAVNDSAGGPEEEAGGGGGGAQELNAPENLIQYYQPVQEKLNIEVKKKNVIMRDGKEFKE